MDWLKHYNLLIEKRRLNPPADDEYVERHHIIPRCMKGTNAPTNIIRLRPEDHFFSHVLLAKHYGTHRLWAAVRIMAAAVGGEHSHYSRVRKMYGLSRRLYVAENGGRDQHLYDFISESGIKATCTRWALKKKYNLTTEGVYRIVSGRIKTHRGWALLSKSLESKFCWGMPHGSLNYKTDQTIRKWRRKDGLEFTGATYALAEKHGLISNALSGVTSGKEASSQGWYLSDRFDEYPSSSSLKAHTRQNISIKHKDGRILDGSRPIVMAKAELTFNDTCRLVNGTRRTAKGWSLVNFDPSLKRPKKKRMPSQSKIFANVSHADFGKFEGNASVFADKYYIDDHRKAVSGFASLARERRAVWKGWSLTNNFDLPDKSKGRRRSAIFAHLHHPDLGAFVGNASDFADMNYNIDCRNNAVVGLIGLVRGSFASWHGWRLA